MFVVVCCLVNSLFTVAIDLILLLSLSLFTILFISRFILSTLLYLNRFNTKVSEFAIQLNIQIERKGTKKSEQ